MQHNHNAELDTQALTFLNCVLIQLLFPCTVGLAQAQGTSSWAARAQQTKKLALRVRAESFQYTMIQNNMLARGGEVWWQLPF